MARKKKVKAVIIRITPELHKSMRASAGKNGVSWNAEANRRLIGSLEADRIGTQADQLIDLVRQRLERGA